MSQRVFRTVAASVLGLGLAAGVMLPAAAGPAGSWSGADAQRAQLRELARNVVAAGAPGVIVRVDDGRGRPIEIAEQADWTRRDHRLRPDDEFREGSNTKTMMATLVLQLVAEHKVSLTDPVERWLPGAVPNGRAITVRMVLNHTSGLFDYTEDPAIVPVYVGRDPHATPSLYPVAYAARRPANWPRSPGVLFDRLLERAHRRTTDYHRSSVWRPPGIVGACRVGRERSVWVVECLTWCTRCRMGWLRRRPEP